MQTSIGQDHAEHMLLLKEHLKNLNAIICNKKVCFLDLPVHNNVGDLLILKGTLTFFKENNYQITHYFSCFSFYEDAIPNDVTIVFQGGGNFGDLYRFHQQLREQVIAKYPNHRIVILPQTVYYKSAERYKETGNLLKKHQDLHICLRDNVSYELAKSFSSNIYLLPDMAHQLYPINVIAVDSSKKCFYFKRRDIELKAELDEELLGKVDDIGDWADLIRFWNALIITSIRRTQRIFNILGLNKFTAKFTGKLWLIFVDLLLTHVYKKMSRFNFVYSNRMHGYILANLMRIDCCLIDNNYSKNKTYYDTWMAIVSKKDSEL